MIVQCPKCRTRFRIGDDKVTETGVKVRCSRCAHVFVVRRSDSVQADALFDTGMETRRVETAAIASLAAESRQQSGLTHPSELPAENGSLPPMGDVLAPSSAPELPSFPAPASTEEAERALGFSLAPGAVATTTARKDAEVSGFDLSADPPQASFDNGAALASPPLGYTSPPAPTSEVPSLPPLPNALDSGDLSGPRFPSSDLAPPDEVIEEGLGTELDLYPPSHEAQPMEQIDEDAKTGNFFPPPPGALEQRPPLTPDLGDIPGLLEQNQQDPFAAMEGEAKDPFSEDPEGLSLPPTSQSSPFGHDPFQNNGAPAHIEHSESDLIDAAPEAFAGGYDSFSAGGSLEAQPLGRIDLAQIPQLADTSAFEKTAVAVAAFDPRANQDEKPKPRRVRKDRWPTVLGITLGLACSTLLVPDWMPPSLQPYSSQALALLAPNASHRVAGSLDNVRSEGARAYTYPTPHGEFLVVSGQALNLSDKTHQGLKATVLVMDGDQEVARRQAPVGFELNAEQLVAVKKPADLDALYAQAGKKALKPQESLPYVVVFPKVPAQAQKHRYRVEFVPQP